MWLRTFLLLLTATVIVVKPSDAQIVGSALSTAPTETGYLTKGDVEFLISNRVLVMGSYREASSHRTESVEAAEISTLSATNREYHAELMIRRASPSFSRLALSGGIAYWRFADERTAAYVLVDDMGEYGTEFAEDRITNVVAPAVGLVWSLDRNDNSSLPLDVRYSATFVPLYWANSHQNLSLRTIEMGLEEYENTNSTLSGPMIRHAAQVLLFDWLSASGEHTFQRSKLESFRPGADGFTLETFTESVIRNELRVAFGVRMSIQSVELGASLGRDITWIQRGSTEVLSNVQSGRTSQAFVEFDIRLMDRSVSD